MATIKFGAIVTDIRGKLGGHVFQKGNQSSVLKTLTKPTSTTTPSNRATNQFVATARNGWNNLSAADKLIWGRAAGNFRFPSTFGDTIQYTGFQMYMHLNTRLSRVGYPINDVVSNFQQRVNGPVGVAFVLNISAQTLTPSITGSFSGRRILLEVSYSRGFRSYPNPKSFHFLNALASFTGSASPNYLNLVSYFGQPSLTDTIFIRYALVNQSGFRSAWESSKVVIV